MAKKLNVAVLLSGSGTTLANLLAWIRREELAAEINLVISSRPGVKGLQIARDLGIDTAVVDAKRFPLAAREAEVTNDWRAMSAQINKYLLPGNFDLICMAGFLSRYVIPPQLAGRVINIHPALIPMFCGQGMYGSRVHRAVVEAGVRVTGCTVHFADNEYDNGPIILQRACPVYSDDTPGEVAARVFAEECQAYPAAINLIAQGRVRLAGNGRAVVEDDRSIKRFTVEHAF